jgi:hypothetical protein
MLPAQCMSARAQRHDAEGVRGRDGDMARKPPIVSGHQGPVSRTKRLAGSVLREGATGGARLSLGTPGSSGIPADSASHTYREAKL